MKYRFMMNRDIFFETLNEHYNHGARREIQKTFENHIDQSDIEVACEDIAEYIYSRYSSFNADAMAGLMEMAIKHNPQIALVNFPDNYLFHLTLLTGSVDLYECFIEEAIEPHLQSKNEDEAADYYSELYIVASKVNDKFFPEYKRCIKGLDFNGAFSRDDIRPGIAQINTSDYEIMNEVVEKYNTIIGRRDIIADLEERE